MPNWWSPPISLFQLSSSLNRFTPKTSFITTTNDKPRIHYHQHHQQPHKNPKECTGNPQPNPTSLKKKKKKNAEQKKTEVPPEDPTRNNETTASAALATTVNAKYKVMSPVKLPISRSTCLTIPPGLSPTSFLESPILLSNMKVWSLSLASDLEVHVSHDPTWAQSDVVSRIPCSPLQHEGLVSLSLMRRRFVLYFEKKNVGFGLGSRFLLNFYFGFSFKIMIFFFFFLRNQTWHIGFLILCEAGKKWREFEFFFE